MLLALAIQTCHNCEHRQDPCGADCLCLKSGKPFVRHAKKYACPANLFPDPTSSFAARPAYPIPDDFDPERERLRMQQGGCCGSPSADAAT
jgi:hypothetical protein